MVPFEAYKDYTLVCPKNLKVTNDKSVNVGFDENLGPNNYRTTCNGPEFSISYNNDNLCFVFRVYLPPN